MRTVMVRGWLAAAGLLTIAWWLLPAWDTLAEVVTSPQAVADRHGADALVLTLATAALALLCIWTAVACLALSLAPRRATGSRGSLLERLTPALMRRLAASLVGLGVLPLAACGPQPEVGATAPAVTVSAHADSSAAFDWPVADGVDDAQVGEDPLPAQTPTGTPDTPPVSDTGGPATSSLDAPESATSPQTVPLDSPSDVPAPETDDPAGTPAPPPEEGAPAPAPTAPDVVPGLGSGGGSVVVPAGGSLWQIATDELGPDASTAQIAYYVEDLYLLNAALIGADPDLIHPGTQLALPAAPIGVNS